MYNFLDWLRDIGGLYGAVSAICIAMVFIFQFKGVNMFIMTEMFGAISTKDPEEMSRDTSSKLENFQKQG